MTPTLITIGNIRTPYTSIDECPHNIQFDGPTCQIVLSDNYKQGLNGLAVGEYILVLYWLEGAQRDLLVQAGKKGINKGTFSLRSPHRPNPIGAAVLPIESIQNGIITVKGLDCLDNTALIDIKPAIYRENVN
ncbi:tRNA (N6-threonylcarbamoyladenosine(37)-N6)-methyltransferase TrmO [Vibrio sp. 10N.261.51.F12]|uniref:tRNA (N6-threonylcarbamoyladenosine(37)-N6)-methyltransferase TrmO n=1 Tax=Vibrio sp. 10N.261.51.F12 TaxID=3229679 RepID=UPI003550FB46